MMEGEGSDGGTDGGEASGGAGLSFHLQAVVFICGWPFLLTGGHLRAWVAGHVLGAHHSRIGVVVICVVICGCSCHPWGWVVVYECLVVICGQ